MVINILLFHPRGQFQGLIIGQKVITPNFTPVTKMMSNLSSWLFPLFKDTSLLQIGPLVQKIWCFKIGHTPSFSLNFQIINSSYLRNRSSDQRKSLDLRFGGQNQHVCQISLNSERVGLKLPFLERLDMEWPTCISQIISIWIFDIFQEDWIKKILEFCSCNFNWFSLLQLWLFSFNILQ